MDPITYLKSLSDEDLVRACAKNPQYRDLCDEYFYRDIVKTRHPFWTTWLEQYGNSYKKLFLTSVAYIDRLKNELGITYHDSGWPPEDHYNSKRLIINDLKKLPPSEREMELKINAAMGFPVGGINLDTIDDILFIKE